MPGAHQQGDKRDEIRTTALTCVGPAAGGAGGGDASLTFMVIRLGGVRVYSSSYSNPDGVGRC